MQSAKNIFPDMSQLLRDLQQLLEPLEYTYIQAYVYIYIWKIEKKHKGKGKGVETHRPHFPLTSVYAGWSSFSFVMARHLHLAVRSSAFSQQPSTFSPQSLCVIMSPNEWHRVACTIYQLPNSNLSPVTFPWPKIKAL